MTIFFFEAFQIYVEKQEEKEGAGWWYRCRLIRPGYFYDPNVTAELLKRESSLFSGKSSLSQWKQGDNIPAR